MDQNAKNLIIPIIGIIVATIGYTTMILLFAVDLETGTAAEWTGALGAITVGLVAAAFAGLAWRETQRATDATKRATFWAEIAAKAQQQANDLLEATMTPHVTIAIERHIFDDGSEAVDRNITLTLESRSRAPIWIHTFATILGRFVHVDGYLLSADSTRHSLDSENIGFPHYLVPEEEIAVLSPYQGIHQKFRVDPQSWALADITYSFTKEGPQHELLHLDIDLTDITQQSHAVTNDRNDRPLA